MDVRKSNNPDGSEEGGRVKAELGIKPEKGECGSDTGRHRQIRRGNRSSGVEAAEDTGVCLPVLPYSSLSHRRRRPSRLKSIH